MCLNRVRRESWGVPGAGLSEHLPLRSGGIGGLEDPSGAGLPAFLLRGLVLSGSPPADTAKVPVCNPSAAVAERIATRADGPFRYGSVGRPRSFFARTPNGIGSPVLPVGSGLRKVYDDTSP